MVPNHPADENQIRWLDTPPDHPQNDPVVCQDGPVVYSANEFDCRLPGVKVPLCSSRQNFKNSFSIETKFKRCRQYFQPMLHVSL